MTEETAGDATPSAPEGRPDECARTRDRQAARIAELETQLYRLNNRVPVRAALILSRAAHPLTAALRSASRRLRRRPRSTPAAARPSAGPARQPLMRMVIQTPVPRAAEAERWGDTHFAEGVAAALRPLGVDVEIVTRDQWSAGGTPAADVVLHLRGRGRGHPDAGALNVLWIICHPDDVSTEECDEYDLVFVASEVFAAQLAEQTSTPVHYLPQATDAARFFPHQPDPALATPLLFVGEGLRVGGRHSVSWARQSGLAVTVVGPGWDDLPAEQRRGEFIPNDQLARHYASADVVLNDHWPDMAACGFVSNRVFDVLASGGVVISDPVVGMEQLFGDLVPVFRTAEELVQLVETLTTDHQRRDALVARATELIAREHTFDVRAARLLAVIQERLAARLTR